MRTSAALAAVAALSVTAAVAAHVTSADAAPAPHAAPHAASTPAPKTPAAHATPKKPSTKAAPKKAAPCIEPSTTVGYTVARSGHTFTVTPKPHLCYPSRLAIVTYSRDLGTPGQPWDAVQRFIDKPTTITPRIPSCGTWFWSLEEGDTRDLASGTVAGPACHAAKVTPKPKPKPKPKPAPGPTDDGDHVNNDWTIAPSAYVQTMCDGLPVTTNIEQVVVTLDNSKSTVTVGYEVTDSRTRHIELVTVPAGQVQVWTTDLTYGQKATVNVMAADALLLSRPLTGECRPS